MSVLESADGEMLHLADDFAEVGEDGWLVLAAKALNRSRSEDDQLDGEAVRARLRTTLGGGLTTEALYLPQGEPASLGYPGSMPFTRGAGPRSRAVPWGVRQLFDDPDPAATREAVTQDIEHGVTSLWLEVGEGAVSAADLPAILDGVLFDLAPVAVSSWTDQPAAADALAGVWRAAPEPGTARGCLGLDPLGLAAVQGTPADLSWLAEKAAAFGAEFPAAHPIVVDSRPYHDAGGSEVDEIACAIATGVAYLRALEAAGVAPAEAFKLIEFRLTAGVDQFLTTASFRALRRLWARVGEASGVPEADRGA